MLIPTPARALSGAFCVLCLRGLRAKARGVRDHDCVWFPASSKCEYCTAPHYTCIPLPWFLDEEYRVLAATEAADPWDPAAVEATATEANRVALVAAQSIPKFRSAAERDSYEELHARHPALEAGLAQIRSSLCRLWTEQGSVPALLGEVVAAVGRLPAVAVTAMVPDHAGGRKKGGDEGGEGEGHRFGAQYGAEEDGA
ncbi:hypothetical protein GMDG_04438 [Pseudogymnoascus destructans 20631-21]|uniref:Uncharacterized protein n=1 Tax=Pseudogymnoascus destructans (strain ATCC MYA-4855 / 20631-21) TaxID=658429 RepID=L8GBL1_PSED2|nr:hypothetical protein GMDG_04438 [Pseudogymnoascus destructans 20631-21]